MAIKSFPGSKAGSLVPGHCLSLDTDSLTSISWLFLVLHMHIILLASWLMTETQFKVKKVRASYPDP